MYDDKKYSPCYNGYRVDLLFMVMIEYGPDRPDFFCNLADLASHNLALYNHLNSSEQT